MKVSAKHVAESIKTVQFFRTHREQLAMKSPVILKQDNQYLVIFAYGIIVTWTPEEETPIDYLPIIQEHLRDAASTLIHEDLTVHVGKTAPHAETSDIYIHELTTKYIAIISLALSRSLALEYYEKKIDNLMEELGVLIKQSTRKRNHLLPKEKLLSFANNVMQCSHSTGGNLSLLDTPDLVWNDQSVFSFYKDLLEEYEIEERYTILSSRMDILFKQTEFLLQIFDNHKSHLLEWIIIILIVFDIAIYFI